MIADDGLGVLQNVGAPDPLVRMTPSKTSDTKCLLVSSHCTGFMVRSASFLRLIRAIPTMSPFVFG